MKRFLGWMVVGWVAWGMLLSVSGQWMTQPLTLNPGWNAVHLQVEPAQAECAILFSNTPVQRVYWWRRSGTGMEFDLDPANPFPRSADWHTWFATNASISTFAGLLAGESYEIFVATNAAPFTLNIPGRPVLNATRWIPGEANLVGLPVATNNLVSFTDFFSFSSDFVLNPSTATLFRISGLSNTLQRVWTPATERPRRGEAYWIVAGRNARAYAGPIRVGVETPSRRIDFGASLSPRTLVIQNLTATNRRVQVRHEPSEAPPALPELPTLLGPVPLLFKDLATDASYQPLPPVWETNLAAGSRLELSLAPDPTALTNGTATSAWQSLLRVTDSDNVKFAAPTVDHWLGVSCEGAVSAELDPRGLWIGQVTVTEVERAPTREGVVNVWAGDGPTPVAEPFSFRVIFHVAADGTVRLLQRALLAWRVEPAEGEALSEEPPQARLTILTDEAEAETFAAQYPEARIVRVSSPNFPLMAPVPAAAGSVFGGTLNLDVTVPFNDPVNPFVHRFHPQHDNLRYDNGVATPLSDGEESYTVTRALQFRFATLDPALGITNRQWGATEQGGLFDETVTGLNKTLRARGTFQVQRVSREAALGAE